MHLVTDYCSLFSGGQEAEKEREEGQGQEKGGQEEGKEGKEGSRGTGNDTCMKQPKQNHGTRICADLWSCIRVLNMS